MTADTTDMLAVHDCFRHQFARLPIMVKAVGEGDAERAAVVGGHVQFMATFLHAHHSSEDLIVWPLLLERAPEDAALVATMREEHAELEGLVGKAAAQAAEWSASPGHQERAGLHTTLIALERALLHHMAQEEQEVLPLVAEHLSEEEYAAVGAHSRADLAPDQLAIALGFILGDTTQDRAEAIIASMPAEAVAGFEQFGRPIYADYKARLTDF